MFGQRLKELRLENDITQKSLGNTLGVSDRSVGFYESEDRVPPQDILIKIADYFNVSTDYLLGRTDFKRAYMLNINNLPESLKNAGIDYLETSEYTKKYGLSKRQIQDILEQAIQLTQIAKDK